jgi:hypothetical protein
MGRIKARCLDMAWSGVLREVVAVQGRVGRGAGKVRRRWSKMEQCSRWTAVSHTHGSLKSRPALRLCVLCIMGICESEGAGSPLSPADAAQQLILLLARPRRVAKLAYGGMLNVSASIGRDKGALNVISHVPLPTGGSPAQRVLPPHLTKTHNKITVQSG